MLLIVAEFNMESDEQSLSVNSGKTQEGKRHFSQQRNLKPFSMKLLIKTWTSSGWLAGPSFYQLNNSNQF